MGGGKGQLNQPFDKSDAYAFDFLSGARACIFVCACGGRGCLRVCICPPETRARGAHSLPNPLQINMPPIPPGWASRDMSEAWVSDMAVILLRAPLGKQVGWGFACVASTCWLVECGACNDIRGLPLATASLPPLMYTPSTPPPGRHAGPRL